MRISIHWIMLCCFVVSGVARADDLRIGLPLSSDSKEWEFVSRTAEKITSLSTGKVSVQLVSPSNNEAGVATEIKSGKLDGGLVMMKDFRKLQLGQDALAFAVPFTFKSAKEVDYVREQLDAEILRKLSAGPYEAIAVMEFSFAYVMSSQVLAHPSDWRNRKIWISAEREFSDNIAASLDALGLKTVSGFAKDVQKDLKSGVVDTVIVPPTVAIIKRWHKKIGNVFNVPFTYNYGLWVVRDDALEKLSSEEQEAAREHLLLLCQHLSTAIRERNDKALDVMARRGIEFVELNVDMRNQWESWANKIWDDLDDEYRPTRDIEEKLKKHLESFLHEKEMRQVSP